MITARKHPRGLNSRKGSYFAWHAEMQVGVRDVMKEGEMRPHRPEDFPIASHHRLGALSLVSRAALLGLHQEGSAGQRGPGAWRGHFSPGGLECPRESWDRGGSRAQQVLRAVATREPQGHFASTGGLDNDPGVPTCGPHPEPGSQRPARGVPMVRPAHLPPASGHGVGGCLPLEKKQGHFLKQNEANLSQVRQ